MVNVRAKSAMIVVVIGCVGVVNASGCKPKPAGPSEAVGSVAKPVASASASVAKAPEARGLPTGAAIVTIQQLPGIDELFARMQGAGVGEQLVASIKPKAKAFAAMKEGERALSVGSYLSDLIMSSAQGAAVPVATLEEAKAAVQSLNPPESVVAMMGAAIESAREKDVDPKELRIKIDTMVAHGVPLLEQDPKLQTTARLVRAGAFLRTMALVGRELQGESDAKKLVVLSQPADINLHLQTFAKLSEELKAEEAVKKALTALETIKDNVAKPEITTADAKAIAGALKDYV